MNKTVKIMFCLLGSLGMYFSYLILNINIFSETLGIVGVAIFSLVLIPVIFEIILSMTEPEIRYYHFIHAFFIGIPIGLLGYNHIFGNKYSVIISFAISLGVLPILYSKLRFVILKNIQQLKYSNTLLIAVLSVVVTIIGLATENVDTLFTIIYISPLICLQVLYEKIAFFEMIEENVTKLILEGYTFKSYICKYGVLIPGTNEYGLKKDFALTAIKIARQTNITILGGDVYTITNSNIIPSYANWSINLSKITTRTSKKSCIKSKNYICNYLSKEDSDNLFVFVS